MEKPCASSLRYSWLCSRYNSVTLSSDSLWVRLAYSREAQEV